jgi:hypothetical protein
MVIDVKRLKGYRNTNENLCKEGIVTYRDGLHYDIFNFIIESSVPELLDKVAFALSKQARYNGHTGNKNSNNFGFYSVAQHSVMMSQSILFTTGNVDLAKQALLHDSGEAFVGDVIQPLKKSLGDKVKSIEDNIEKIIMEKFGLPFPLDPLIKMVDLNIAEFEMTILLRKNSHIPFDYWSPEKSYNEFINMYKNIETLSYYQDKEIFTKPNTQNG